MYNQNVKNAVNLDNTIEGMCEALKFQQEEFKKFVALKYRQNLNMKYELEDMVQRSHNYCIVDEVDSILIDESRTPS